MTKINISISEELAKRVDEYCERNYISRSALFAQSANQFLLEQSIPQVLGEMSVAFKRMADNNAIDEENMKKLNDFMYLAKLLGSTK